QAEDGIRAGHVTGVQTCALPIYVQYSNRIDHDFAEHPFIHPASTARRNAGITLNSAERMHDTPTQEYRPRARFVAGDRIERRKRSEERRVGKEGGPWWGGEAGRR